MTTETAISESLQEATPSTSDPVQDTNQATEQDTPQAEESNSETEKLKATYEKRISRITAARHAEARRAQEYEAQLKALQVPKEEPSKPKESDFDTVEDYHKAIGKYEAQQEFTKKEAEAKQKEAEKRRQVEVEKLQKVHQAKEAEFRKANPRYDENAAIVNEAIELADRDTPEFRAFADAWLTSDNAAALTNYLGENPDVLESLFSKNAPGIYREIARIETLLATPPEEEEPEVKQVPAPPSPIGGTGKVAQKSLDKMTPKQLMEWVRK